MNGGISDMVTNLSQKSFQAEYIGDESKVQQIKYTFTLYHRVSSEIMAQIVNFTNNIRRPIMLWKNGVTIVENLAQVVVQLMNNTGKCSGRSKREVQGVGTFLFY